MRCASRVQWIAVPEPSNWMRGALAGTVTPADSAVLKRYSPLTMPSSMPRPCGFAGCGIGSL